MENQYHFRTQRVRLPPFPNPHANLSTFAPAGEPVVSHPRGVIMENQYHFRTRRVRLPPPRPSPSAFHALAPFAQQYRAPSELFKPPRFRAILRFLRSACDSLLLDRGGHFLRGTSAKRSIKKSKKKSQKTPKKNHGR